MIWYYDESLNMRIDSMVIVLSQNTHTHTHTHTHTQEHKDIFGGEGYV